MKSILLVGLLFVCGCGPNTTMPKVETQPNDRVSVERIGVFEDNMAYNSKRGIYIITDKKTGKEYIGVSGIGITESGSHLAGKIVIKDER